MKGDGECIDLIPDRLVELEVGTEVVPQLVTGPSDQATEPNGQLMKPSGALASELTEKVEPSVGSGCRKRAPTCGSGPDS